MDTEKFLRKYFGLKGNFYTDEFQAVVDNWSDETYNAWLKKHANEDEMRLRYTDEAWALWDKALQMADDLAEAGYDLREVLVQFLCDNC